MSVYIYCRVSGAGSADNGVSEEQQIRCCLQYCNTDLAGKELGEAHYPADAPPGVFVDRGVSAWKNALGERPAGNVLWKTIKSGDQVVFLNISRSSRNVVHFGQMVSLMQEAGVGLHFVEERINLDCANGRLMANIIVSMAEHYAALTSERTKEAKAIAKQGRRMPGSEKVKWERSDVKLPEIGETKPNQLPPGTIYMYARCSTKDQELSGLGMEVQIRGVANYAKGLQSRNNDLTICNDIFQDPSVSAFKVPFKERAAASRMLGLAKPGDHIIIYRTDRAFRHAIEALVIIKELKEKGVFVHLVDGGVDTSTAHGEMWIAIMSLFANLESQMKSQRSKEVRKHLMAAGRPVGTLPYYTKCVVKDGVKRLAYDHWKITELCIYHVLASLGYDTGDISDVLYVRWRQKNQKHRAVSRRARAEYTPVYVKSLQGKFIEMSKAVTSDVFSRGMRAAIRWLEGDMNPKFFKRCAVDLPLENIKDRLDALGITVQPDRS